MNTANHAHKRPWGESEDKFLWKHRNDMTFGEIGAFLGRSKVAIGSRLRYLRARHGRESAGPERQIVADEVIKELTRHVVTGRLSRVEAEHSMTRLRSALAQPDAVILSRCRWTVANWVEHISP